MTEEYTAVLIFETVVVKEFPISDPSLVIQVAKPTHPFKGWVSGEQIESLSADLAPHDTFHYGVQKGNRIYYWKV